MQRKMLIEREGAALGPGTRHRDCRPGLVVGLFAIGYDDIEPVNGAAQHHDDKPLWCRRRRPARRRQDESGAGGGEAEKVASVEVAHRHT